MSSLHFPKNRITAAFIHLILSATLLALLISVVAFIWYPGALLFAGGAEQGLKIVIGVDMILGPMLTLVVYNIQKKRKELIRDLAIIGIFQFSCLFVGMSLVYDQRPLAVVYSGKDFYVLDQQKLDKHAIDITILETFEGSFPKVIFEKPPENEEDNAQYLVSKLPYFPLSFHSELWEIFPQDPAALEKYFKITDIENCFEVNLISYNQVGTACFRTSDLTFSNYK